MINLSGIVFSWYKQQQSIPHLFTAAATKQRKISIHEVVNLNAGIILGNGNIGNTLSLLRMARKRGALTTEYLQTVGKPHKIVAIRILRAWNKSKESNPLKR